MPERIASASSKVTESTPPLTAVRILTVLSIYSSLFKNLSTAAKTFAIAGFDFCAVVRRKCFGSSLIVNLDIKALDAFRDGGGVFVFSLLFPSHKRIAIAASFDCN